MKALTVKNPWAWAIIHGGKNVENRSHVTHHRGQIAIHTAKTVDPAGRWEPLVIEAIEEFNSAPVVPGELIKRADLTQLGYVIGIVSVAGCHHAKECRDPATGRLCSEWAHDDTYHWELAHPLAMQNPAEARGMLGLWDWNPTPNPTNAVQTGHQEIFSAHPYSYFCSCGAQATGTSDNPAHYADHIRSVTQ